MTSFFRNMWEAADGYFDDKHEQLPEHGEKLNKAVEEAIQAYNAGQHARAQYLFESVLLTACQGDGRIDRHIERIYQLVAHVLPDEIGYAEIGQVLERGTPKERFLGLHELLEPYRLVDA
jgi:hypothetical protein